MQNNHLILAGIVGLVIIAAISSIIYMLGKGMKMEEERLRFFSDSIAHITALLYLTIVVFKNSTIKKLLNCHRILRNTVLLSVPSLFFILAIEYMFKKYANIEFNPLQNIDLLQVAPILLIITPMVEEIIFRGLILTGLEKHIGEIPAILLSSILFTIAHVQALHPQLLPIVFIESIILSYPVVRWSSLTPCIITHALINLQAIIISFF
ncbi:MAG: CPBP family intramembrane metalloprotease [Thermoproteales archaeon]|nr:CPBP family intramembrane metalloprotease [Thermoproteales archaeon]